MSSKEERLYFLAFVLSDKDKKNPPQQYRKCRGEGEEPEFCKMFLSAFTGWFNFHRAM